MDFKKIVKRIALNFKRSDMLYSKENYYKWLPAPFTKSTDTELRRQEGNAVLSFINDIVDRHWASPGQSVCHKIERLIRYEVPAKIKDRKTMEQWLITNWNIY